MSQETEKHRSWIQGSFANFLSPSTYYLGKALIQELGEEKGTALIIKQRALMGIF